MYDKRAEKDAVRWGILDKMEALEKDLLRIQGIVCVEFDIRGYGDGIRQVILIPQYFVDPALEVARYYEARYQQLVSILTTCADHNLYPSGDRIEDMGQHWYIVRSCGPSWPVVAREIEEAQA